MTHWDFVRFYCYTEVALYQDIRAITMHDPGGTTRHVNFRDVETILMNLFDGQQGYSTHV